MLARRYTKGLVLYRTDLWGHSADFLASSSEMLALDGWYRRVSRVAGDEVLSEPIRELRLAG